MGNSEAANATEDRIGPILLNTITVVFMYSVILIFYARQMMEFGPGNRGPNVWLNTLVEAVSISTLTYVFPAALQNSFQRKKLIRHGIFLLIFDILYAFLYTVFIPRPLFLNIILCVCTVALVFWTSLLVYHASKKLETGQAGNNKMKDVDASEQPEETTGVKALRSSGNNRIT